MAISFVNSALGGTTTTTSFSITLPATSAGDLIILEYVHRDTTNATLGGTYSGGAWTPKHNQPFGLASAFSAKTVWSRATGNHTGQTVTGSSLTNSCAAIITIYSGALASGDPLADATIVGEPNEGGDETQAEITTTTDGAWVVLVVANSPDLTVTNQACTSPGALTTRAQRLSTGGTDSSIAHASAEKATAGATGAFTWAQTNDRSGSWAYAITPEGGAGATDLVVADLTVTAVADAPTLTQVHSLTVADLTVASVSDAPALTQVHQLTVADLTVATVADTPTLTQVHQLAVADLAVTTTIDTVTLALGAIDLVVADLTVATIVDTPTLTQVHQLVVADLTTSSTIDALTLTQTHQLTVSDLATSATIDTVTLTQIHALDVAGLTVDVLIDTVVLSLAPLADDVLVASTYREPGASTYRDRTVARPYRDPTATAHKEHA